MKMGKTELLNSMIAMREEELEVQINSFRFLDHILDLNIVDDFEGLRDSVMDMREEVRGRVKRAKHRLDALDEEVDN